jgi:hypothetical protein
MTFLILTATLAQAVVPVTTIVRTDMSAVESSREAVVRNAAEWAELWKLHEPVRPAPPVDFEARTVVGVFLGSRPTGGYGIEITEARLEGGELVVEYAERRPGADSMVAQVLTSPAHIVSVPEHAGPVRFVRRAGKP